MMTDTKPDLPLALVPTDITRFNAPTHCVRINRLKKPLAPGNLATSDQGGKSFVPEFVSRNSNTSGGQATIEFAIKCS